MRKTLIYLLVAIAAVALLAACAPQQRGRGGRVRGPGGRRHVGRGDALLLRELRGGAGSGHDIL